jgi:hypothetical protein
LDRFISLFFSSLPLSGMNTPDILHAVWANYPSDMFGLCSKTTHGWQNWANKIPCLRTWLQPRQTRWQLKQLVQVTSK